MSMYIPTPENPYSSKFKRVGKNFVKDRGAQIVRAPSGTGTSSINPVPTATGGGIDSAAAAAATAEANARSSARSQAAKENANTQGIIDALLKSLSGFEKGRDQQISNAEKALQASLSGILSNYTGVVADYNKTGELNEQDEASKSSMNIQNRARERMSLLEQAASQGAGESDQLRAQLQAFTNYDANASEVARSFYDTQRSVNSQIEGANMQAETSRRSAWQQNQESLGSAWQEYWKNRSDTFANIQRTAASNTNVDSDYSVGFNANFGGYDPVVEASRDVGRAYKTEDKDEKWYKSWNGKASGRDTKTTSVNRAASATIKAPKAAEGATLRREW